MSEATVDVVVVGAGAAGLAAARGLRVAVLEARARLGGRIWTKRLHDWPVPVELGAEFIHGGNRTLWELFEAARGVGRRPMPEKLWFAHDGEVQAMPDAWDRIDAVMRRIGPEFHGPFGEWLRQHGGEIGRIDRILAGNFVHGFHGAPSERMSTRVLYALAGRKEEQFFLTGGYDRIIETLATQLPCGQVQVRLKAIVRSVRWRRHRVDVVTIDGSRWRARVAIITVPLGVLRAGAGEPGAIEFDPPPMEKQALWQRIESGHVLRMVVRLRETAWREKILPVKLRADEGRAFGFVQSDAPDFPVWWSEAPAPVLVGWAGGPGALVLAGLPLEKIFHRALHALARIIGCDEETLAGLIVDWQAHDWTSDPFTRGAYSFPIADQEDAPERLAEPVDDTLFFAGEATSDVHELGTVHGALASGERAARETRGAFAPAFRNSLSAPRSHS